MGQTTRRPRALVLAELANPGWVSVPLEGWSHSRALARHADVHLVTHARNRENILAAGLREGEDFTAIATQDPRWARWARKALGARWGISWTTFAAFSVFAYFDFEREVWRRFEADLRAGRFDLVHRLTPLSPTIPSPIAARCAELGVPFVLGPLNGGVPWPPGFTAARLREREFLSYVRPAYRLVPGYRATRDCAHALVAGSRDTRLQLGPAWQAKSVYIPENGVDPARFDRTVEGEARLPLRAAFVGRLVPYKCPDLLVEAAEPLVRAGRLTLDILGDGPLMPELRSAVARKGLEGGVTLAGWVPHQQLKDRLALADVFAFPSVREFGGAVVLEAMATGLVPVVVDYGGPGELVTEATGIKVPLGRRAALVAGFRAALTRLCDEPGAVRGIGRRARERVLRSFTWDAKAAQTAEVYRWAMGLRDRPDFGMPLPDPP